MQIGGAGFYSAPAASLLPARSSAPPVSPSLSPAAASDSKNASQVSLATSQPLAGEPVSASAPETADKPVEPSSRSAEPAAKGEPSPQQQRLEQLEIAKLSRRDEEVRAHEQAHAAVGGRYAGPPSYSFERGPDGKRYAVGGEVSIESGSVADDPEATLRKMEIVLRAALAPADPSAQDLRVAAQAQALMTEARAELSELQRNEAAAAREAREAQAQAEAEREKERAEQDKSAEPERQDLPPPPSLELYRRLGELQEPVQVIDLVA